MTKRLALPIKVETVHYPGQTVLSIVVAREALKDWCLGLCLLSEGLIETLLIAGNHGQNQKELRVNRLPQDFVGVRTRVTSGAWYLEIADTNLEYLQHFFLKYYRDGVAEVDHLDLEATTGEDEAIYVTFKVLETRPPLTPEEAEKWLAD